MKKFLTIFLCMIGLSGFAQDITHATSFGFTFATNVSGAAYSWTNDNDYAFRLLDMSFNSDIANTATVTLVRRHNITPQLVSDVVTTNDMGGIETNYYYIVTNTITSYETNVLLSVTNTATLYDEDDMPKVYIRLGDILRWAFSDTNTKAIVFDALR